MTGMRASTSPSLPAPGWIAADRRVYAVGDVHGCLDALLALHGLIAADLAARPVGHAELVHLGDYVDRGPDSDGVLRHLLSPEALPPCPVVNLIGNHESMMLKAIEGDGSRMPDWLANGGDATLASWGIRAPADELEDPPAWLHRVPAEQRAMLHALPVRHDVDGYLFAHAGVRPDRPLDQATPGELLWMREPFLSWPDRLERVVVHGHTPVRAPAVRQHRIGIDTGRVFGGRLTCVALEADRLRFLAVDGPHPSPT